VRDAIIHWAFLFGTALAVRPIAGQLEAASSVPLVAVVSPGFREQTWQIRPIKRRVGRAVTSTMDKINNPWFVLSQIVIPLCAFLFSLMYVRRHRANQPVETAPQAANPSETGESSRAGP